MAVALAQPTDVVKVRFQAQASSSGPNRRYHGTMQAYKTIAKEEGMRGLWRGGCLLDHTDHLCLLSNVSVSSIANVSIPTLQVLAQTLPAMLS